MGPMRPYKAELRQLNALNFLPWEFLLKKLEIEKTETTFIISVLKVVCQVVLGFFNLSNLFINKNSQGRKLSAKKIPACGYSALVNVCFIKIHSKHSSNTLVSLLQILMKQTLGKNSKKE